MTSKVNCKRCNTEFTPVKGFKTMCSHECKYNKRVVSKESVKKRAKAISKKVVFTCLNDECGISFQDKPSSKRKYCSPSCSSKHRMNKPEVKKKFRELAINQGLGGNVSRGMHGWYESPLAGRVFLESSYEFKVAQELDDNNIKWIRPSKKNGLTYSYEEESQYFIDGEEISYKEYLRMSHQDQEKVQIEEKSRRYFPDFYLPESDVYLDPKNTFRITQDIRKIRLVSQKHNVRVFILTKDELEWDTIASKIGIKNNIFSFFSNRMKK